MQKIFVLSLLIASFVLAEPSERLFDELVRRHGRHYESKTEYAKRLAIFQNNLVRIDTMNKIDAGAHYAPNQFFDLSAEEFKGMYRNYQPRHFNGERVHKEANDIPQSWDWRQESGVVGPVKNQAQCGSCWAFSTIAGVESQWVLANHTYISLSEQQLVACDNGSSGCTGGDMEQAAQYIISVGGVESEAVDPYTESTTCLFDPSEIVASISSYEVLADEDSMVVASATHGVVVVGLNAEWLQFYFGGISDPLFCNPNHLDHGVAIVGYGVDGDEDYWIVRNSWGASWGENGYFRMIRGKNKCGIAEEPMTVTV